MTPCTVHTYTAAERGLFVNSYLLESPDAVVLVDAGLLVPDAHALAARITALGKPLAAAFVTHAHPDHFNGLPFVAGDDVPVYATHAVATTIAAIADAKREQWAPVYGDDWPKTHRVPSHRLTGGETVTAGGITFTVHDAGTAESHADSYLVAGELAFIGDLAFNGVHPYTADGHTTSWLSTLDDLEPRLAGTVLHPGHGRPGTVSMLADQRRYLLMYREAVRRLAGGAPSLTEAAKAELETLMTSFLPGAPLTWMIALGADAVAAELAS